MRIKVAAVVMLLVGGRALAEPLTCPAGTVPHGAHDGSITQEWCARSDGTRHGPYRSFSGGTRSSEGAYVDGKQDGLWSSWQANGKPFEQVHYQRGLKHGAWIAWNSNGVVMVRGDYRLGREHGTWTWWHYNGKKKAVTTFVDGVAQGHATEWNEAGRMTSDGEYAAGKRVGKWLENDARGAYCADKRCGHWDLFDETGQLLAAGEYRDGAREGAWTQWFDGKRTARATYVRGRKHGHFERWDLDTGKKVTDIECRRGTPHGMRREWWPNGNLRLAGHYVDGELDGEITVGGIEGNQSRAVYRRGEHVSGDLVEQNDAGIMPDGYPAAEECRPDESLVDGDELPNS